MSTQQPYDSEAPLPTGLLAALAQNMNAMKQYAALDDQGKARLIQEASAVHTGEEMRNLVGRLSDFL